MMIVRLLRGALVGAFVSALMAFVPAALDWFENPGGIFRGDTGTNWMFVLETWWSWAWPLALLTVPVAVGIVLWRARRRSVAPD